MAETLAKYCKEQNHRKLIQSLVSLLNHQDLSQRLIAHSYLVYYAKLCNKKNKKSSIPYCYRLFLIYQTLISVLCDDSEDVRRICIKALFIWIVTCNDDVIIKDLRNKELKVKDIAPLVLCTVGITDTSHKNRIVVFKQLNELLLNPDTPYISINIWIQMFYKKPMKILNVESVTDLIPLYYKPILNNGQFLFLHTSFALNYNDLLNKIDHILNEQSVSIPYLYVHMEALKRTSCGLFSHVLDDEMRECRIAALNTMQSFVKYIFSQITSSNSNKMIEIQVNVARDIDTDSNDTSESKMDIDDANMHDNDKKCKILSRALSFIADLLNDEAIEVRSMTLHVIKDIMVFGGDYLKICDDFLPLIQIMTGDYIQKTRIGAYQTLQYLHLSRPESLLSLIKSLNSSIVRYPNDKKSLLYSLSILSYRHSRLLEPILNELMFHKESLSVHNLKHVCLAVIIHYGSQSNVYLKELISSSVFQYITECKKHSKHQQIFEFKIDENKRTLGCIEDDTLIQVDRYLVQFFSENKQCNLRLLNTIIRMLHSVDINKTKHKIHKFLCLSSILNDILQLIELNVCAKFISPKMIELEHHCIILYKLCMKFNKFKLSKFIFSLCFSLYFIVCHHFGNRKMDYAQIVLQMDQQFSVKQDRKQYIKQQFDDLVTDNISLWQSIQRIFNIQSYMECFKQYNELIDNLTNTDECQYQSNAVRDIIQLKTEQNKIYFHPLAPIQIPLKCVILSEYGQFIKPKIKIKIVDHNGNMDLKYHLFSRKRWMKDLKKSNFVNFDLQLPNLTASTNFNPAKNYCADITIQMLFDHKDCVLFKILNTNKSCNIDIVPSNTLSVSIAIGLP